MVRGTSNLSSSLNSYSQLEATDVQNVVHLAPDMSNVSSPQAEIKVWLCYCQDSDSRHPRLAR